MCFVEKRVASVFSSLTSVSLSHLGGDLGFWVLVTVLDACSSSSSGSKLTSASSSSSSKRRRLRKETLLLLAPFDWREECNDGLVLLKLVSSEALTVSPHCSIRQESKSAGSRHWTRRKRTKKELGERRGKNTPLAFVLQIEIMWRETEAVSHTSDWNYFLRALIRYVSRGDDYTRRFYPHEDFLVFLSEDLHSRWKIDDEAVVLARTSKWGNGDVIGCIVDVAQ